MPMLRINPCREMLGARGRRSSALNQILGSLQAQLAVTRTAHICVYRVLMYISICTGHNASITVCASRQAPSTIGGGFTCGRLRPLDSGLHLDAVPQERLAAESLYIYQPEEK